MLDAEIKYYRNDYAGAVKSLNIIAKRAYGQENFYTSVSKEDVLQALLDEYFIEFVHEGVIWWSLIRLGQLEKYNPVIKDYCKKNVNFIYLPVSQDALNRNSNLEQTVGWGSVSD